MADSKHAASEVSELIDLLKRYVLQETVGPLKTLGRSLGFGAAAAVTLGLGGVFVLLGVLRVLQTETGTMFTGHWSWAPYFLTVVAGLILIAVGGLGLLRQPKAEAATVRVDVTPPRPEAR
ncbi:MAG: hypothetical protein ACLQNG_18985 [Acidimicrobiales bacterium]|jgi:hypothetical protein